MACAVLLVLAFGCARSPREELLARPFHVIAHRGASAYAPENTLAAFRRAVELGADEVEVDVQLSADDQIVLFHDRRLEKKTNLSGLVRDHPIGTLRRAEIGSWFDKTHPDVEERFAGTRLNTLTELFEELGASVYYHIEIKSMEPQLPALVLDEVARHGLQERVEASSFYLPQLRLLRGQNPDIRITYLIRRMDQLSRLARRNPKIAYLPPRELQKHWIRLAERHVFQQVALPLAEIDSQVIAFARALGLSIRAWRVETEADMEAALEIGIDGMTTDWPDRALRRLEELGRN
jgi:glycerophosphoryl diester phosphodiesterase